MVVDRGRTEYTIELKDQFTAAKERIVQGIGEIDAAFAKLRTSGSGVASAQTQVRQASERLAESSRRRARELTVEEAAERKLQQTIRRRLIDTRTQELAEQRGVQLKRRKVQATTLEEAAERRLQALQRRALISRRALELAEQRGLDLSTRKVRVLTIEEEAERKVEAAIRKRAVAERVKQLELEKGLRTEEAQVRQLTLREQAEKLLEQAIIRRQRAEQAASVRNLAAGLAAERGQDPFALGLADRPIDPVPQEAISRITQARNRLADLRTQLDRANGGGNQLLFTFRRLIGILAVFQAARAGFGAFRQFVSDGISFNATIEQSQLGIASLITAVGTLEDQFGRAVDGVEALDLALEVARRQTLLLRRDSLTTTATFQELLDTFQVALAPGLTAGLDINQVREFSVRISQAAASLGVAQNQLSEEIRSILAGTIQLRTTRIAAALGITNEDIRRAREAGNLAQFLTERFEAFGISGERATQTFSGLLNVVRGAFQELAADASFPLFEDLKAILDDIFNTLVQIGPDGVVIINPEAVAAVQPIFDGILVAVRAIRDSAGEIGFEGLFAISQTLGDVLGVAGTVLAGVIEGVAAGLQDVVRLVRVIAGLFGDIGGDDLRDVVAQVTRLATILGSISVTAALIGAAFSLFISPLRIAVSLVTSLASGVIRVAQGMLAIPAPLIAAVSILAGLVLGFREIAESIFGVQLTIRETIDLLGLGLAGAFQAVATFGQTTFVRIGAAARELFEEIKEEGEQLLIRARLLVARATFDSQQDVIRDELADAQAAERVRERQAALDLERRIAEVKERGAAVQLEIEKEIAKIVGEAAGREARGEEVTFLTEIEQLAAGLSETLAGVINGDIVDAESLSNKLKEVIAQVNNETTITPRGTPITDEQRQQLAEAQQALAITQQQVEARRALNDLEAANASDTAIRTQELRNQLGELQTQLMTQQALDEIERDRAQAAINGANGAEQRTQLEAELNTLISQQEANTALLLERQRELTIELERQREIQEGSVGEGFARGLDNFANQFASAFEAGVAIAEGTLQQFAGFISQTIVSAFDPTNDQSVTERFARFLQSIGQLILQQVVQLGIAQLLQQQTQTAGAVTAATATTTAATALTTAATAIGVVTPGLAAAAVSLATAAQLLIIANATGGGIGFHEGGLVGKGYHQGGPVERARGRASRAHARAKGLAAGGPPGRPAGLHPSDTIPAWLGKGEFVEPVASVSNYGSDFMEGLRRRIFDPDILRSAAGLRAMGRIQARASRGPGFQQGGLVSEQVAAQTQLQQQIAASDSTGAEGGLSRSAVVASEAEFDKLLAGGGRASIIRLFQRDRGTFRGILGV